MLKIPPAILSRVAKPARYTGQELNSVKKDHNAVTATVALAFPDVYDVGMSHLGLKILAHILNLRADVVCERVYAPWPDMEAEMRAAGLPLYALESYRPLAEFDMVGFTLQYELSYSNILNMLDLGGIPLLAAERGEDDTFVIAGGPCAYNAEPLADFIDFFVLGEAEKSIDEIADALVAWKTAGKPGGRQGFLAQVAAIAGIYVPSFYSVCYTADGTLAAVTPTHPAAAPRIEKRVVADLDQAPYPTKPVLPFLEVVHDRIMLEIFRGCTRGCRFCQAGNVYRPVRERRTETLVRLAQEMVDSTGYSEMSLTSLSSADYSCLHDLVIRLIDRFQDQGVSVSLPSLRIDSFSIQLAQEIQKVRKSGLTFAPEAGTQRLRDVINKGVTEQDLEEAVGAAFRAGWSGVKLYFMIGLPTETDEDVKGIAALARRVQAIYREVTGKRGAKVSVSVSSFVPKSHTPFQWFGQNDIAEIERKQLLLRSELKDRSISLSWHDAQVSYLEAVFARGDRRLGRVLLAAWRQGAKFDGWSEYFKFDIWQNAFASEGVDPTFYARRERPQTELLPWDHLGAGIDKEFLAREYRQAIAGEVTADCRRGDCQGCGVCQGLGVEIIDWEGKI
jgi:radical SAM family uncharacterized protein